MEYEKLRNEKRIVETPKTSEGQGEEVKMNKFVTELSSGRDISDMYLKHPGNESSEDEDGVENEAEDDGGEENAESNFMSFVNQHKTIQNEKIDKNTDKI